MVPANILPGGTETPLICTVEDAAFSSIAPGDTVDGPNDTRISLTVDGLTRDRACTMRSKLLPNGRDSTPSELLDLEQAECNDAEDDLRATLADFHISIGPQHTDEDGSVRFAATIADVNEDVDGGGNKAKFPHQLLYQKCMSSQSRAARPKE